MRILSKANFERRIEELKHDSGAAQQEPLIKGIYVIRSFCLDKKTNVFLVPERTLQQNDEFRGLIYRLLDYRIIHSGATALSHKSSDATRIFGSFKESSTKSIFRLQMLKKSCDLRHYWS